MIEKNKIYKLKEASELTGISVDTLKRRIKAKRLKILTKPGEHTRFWGSDLLKMLENNDD